MCSLAGWKNSRRSRSKDLRTRARRGEEGDAVSSETSRNEAPGRNPCCPKGCDGDRQSAASRLLEDVPHRLRRHSLHLGGRRSQRGPREFFSQPASLGLRRHRTLRFAAPMTAAGSTATMEKRKLSELRERPSWAPAPGPQKR